MTVIWQPTLAALQAAISGVASITVTNGGSGYTSKPSVTLAAPPQGGVQATATAVMGVGAVSVTSPGGGYTQVPNIVLSGGGGSGAVCVGALSTTVIGSVTVNTPGTGYTSTPMVQFVGGGGSGATGTCVMNGGQVTGVLVALGGVGYTSAPSVVFSGGGGIGAVGTAILSGIGGTVGGFGGTPTVINTSSMYSTPPTVTVRVPGAGHGANFLAVLNGSLSAVNIDVGNYGYSQTPLCSVAAPDQPGGVQATITANWSSAFSAVSSFNIINAGSGYSFPPAVTIAEADRANSQSATATSVISGPVGSITILNGGENYATASSPFNLQFNSSGSTDATAAVAQTSIGSVTMVSGGYNYSSAPQVDFITNQASAPSVFAAAVAEVSPISVASVNVISGGTGYQFPPQVNISGGGGAGANYFVNTSSGTVSSFTKISGGSGYTSSPIVTVVGGLGSGATATANIGGGQVTSISVNSGGSGYVGPVTAKLIGGQGGVGYTAATTTVNLSPTSLNSVSVVTPGTGYSSPPTASVTSGFGVGASCTVLMKVVGCNVLAGGYEYAVAPSVTITSTVGSGATAICSLSPALLAGDTYSLAEGVTIATELAAIGAEYSAGIPVQAVPIASTYVVPTSVNWSEVDKATRFSADVSTGWFAWPNWSVIPSSDPVLVMMRANLFNTALATYVGSGGVPDQFITETFQPLFALAVPAYAYYLVTLSEVTALLTTPYTDNSMLATQLALLVTQAAEFTTYLDTP